MEHAQRKAAVLSLADEAERIYADIKRLRNRLMEISDQIGFMRYSGIHPVGSTFRKDGKEYVVIGYSENYVLCNRLKVDGTPYAKIQRVSVPSDL